MQRHKTNNGVFFFKETLFFIYFGFDFEFIVVWIVRFFYFLKKIPFKWMLCVYCRWHTTHDNDTVRRAADQNDTLFREESGVDGAVAVCVGREAVLLLLLPRLVVPGQHRSRSSTSDTNAWLFATSAFTYCGELFGRASFCLCTPHISVNSFSVLCQSLCKSQQYVYAPDLQFSGNA